MTQTQSLPEIGQYRIAKDRGGDRVNYEDLEIGKDLGTAPLKITQGQVEHHCERLGTFHPWYSVNSPFGGTIVPIMLTYVVGRRLLSTNYNVVGMFYKWSFDFVHPLLVGVEYSFSARLSEKWIKNEREFVAYEGVCKDAQGNVMFTTRRAHVLDFIKRTAPKIAEGGIESRPTVFDYGGTRQYGTPGESQDAFVTPAATIDVRPIATSETKLGAWLPSHSKAITDEMLDRESEAEKGNFRSHNWEAARMEGLPKAFSGGPPIQGLIHSAALQFFSRGWVEGGRADLTMRRPVFGDFVYSKAFVKGEELLPDGGKRLLCEAWVEDQTGDKKVVGTVSGIVK